MKKLATLLLGVIVASMAYADGTIPSAYEEAMKNGLDQMSKAGTPQDFQNVANTFARIAEAEVDQWHPFYYASYALTISAAMESDPSAKDLKLDAAEKHLKSAFANEHDPVEVHVLQGFVHMIRIGVDPATRGQVFSMKSGESLQKAMAINSENPRALFMLAQLEFGTAQFFGSDFTKACSLNEKALQLFEKEEQSSDQNSFSPSWGKGQAMGFKANCNN